MYKGVSAKFTQNKNLKNLLINTDNNYLVEASPSDKFWGVGLSYNSKDIINQSLWGQNQLGRILMKVRAELLLQKLHNSNIYFFR